jgi:hypothetical protein
MGVPRAAVMRAGKGMNVNENSPNRVKDGVDLNNGEGRRTLI